MLVAHLCKAFSKLSETFIYDYVTEQNRQGIDAHVVTGQRVNVIERPYDSVTVVPWPSVWHPLRLVSRLYELLNVAEDRGSTWRALWPNVQDVVSQLEPEVLHAHFGRAAVKAVPLSRRLGIPLVVTFYGYDISELPRQQGWRRAYEGIWETARAVVVLSEEMKDRAVQWGAPEGKIHVVHLARNLETFRYRAAHPPIRRLVTVGRLTEKKGHFDALRVIRTLIDRGRNVELRIVGDGPLREALEEEIRANGLENHVRLVGALSNEAVADLLVDADAFLLCSKTSSNGDREGTPTVLIEAQAVGLPCISTEHAGIPEMIPERNHQFLAEEGDVEDLVDCAERLLDSSDSELKRVSEAGREKVETDFHLEREVEKLRGIYDHVLREAA